jgi:hypothetical protein
VSEATAYAKAVRPRVAFPVHDATLNEIGKSVTYPHFSRELEKEQIGFSVLALDIPTEL